MFDLDKWQEILQTITRNKSRSLLTAFGIFWGVFMLVFLMGGGDGLRKLMASNFEGLAQNSGFVMKGKAAKAYGGFKSGREWNLQISDVDLLQRRVPALETVTPIMGAWGQTATRNHYSTNATLKGVLPEYANIEAPHITLGRFLNDSDVQTYRKVCVIGKRIWETLFPNIDNPCGQFICVGGVYYQVVGVSKMSSNIGVMGSAESTVIIPYSTFARLYNRGTTIESIGFTARRGHTITELTPLVEETLRKAHTLAPDDKRAILLINMEAMFQMIDSLFAGIDTLVWLIGLGTLLSGAIGVSNIMMVTVRERTAEIGIRRAIGARPRHILTQIMAESMVLTVLAGMSGIVFAVLLLQGVESVLLAQGTEASFQVSFSTAIGSTVALCLLGSAAGIAPSLRALAIKPIEAIRDE